MEKNNMKIETKGKSIVITIDASKEMGPSRSGKSIVVASSYGAIPVAVDGETINVNINVYKRK